MSNAVVYPKMNHKVNDIVKAETFSLGSLKNSGMLSILFLWKFVGGRAAGEWEDLRSFQGLLYRSIFSRKPKGYRCYKHLDLAPVTFSICCCLWSEGLIKIDNLEFT
jgi:hypothetical protein